LLINPRRYPLPGHFTLGHPLIFHSLLLPILPKSPKFHSAKKTTDNLPGHQSSALLLSATNRKIQHKKEKPDKKPKIVIICQKTKIFFINLAILPKYPKLSKLTLPITFSIEGTIF
jgi:hypothetical protein